MQTFMNGLHPSVGDMMSNFIQQIFNRLPELITTDNTSISNSDLELIKQKLRYDSSLLLKSFFDNLSKHIGNDQVAPVISMVNVLPKDELAAMAESMVNLTVFKRKVSNASQPCKMDME